MDEIKLDLLSHVHKPRRLAIPNLSRLGGRRLGAARAQAKNRPKEGERETPPYRDWHYRNLTRRKCRTLDQKGTQASSDCSCSPHYPDCGKPVQWMLTVPPAATRREAGDTCGETTASRQLGATRHGWTSGSAQKAPQRVGRAGRRVQSCGRNGRTKSRAERQLPRSGRILGNDVGVRKFPNPKARGIECRQRKQSDTPSSRLPYALRCGDVRRLVFSVRAFGRDSSDCVQRTLTAS